ncbi:MAG TPA: PilZ domain-containing protein [Terriglobales bacterium]|nr:PilZ domain-containing protein [Terriglobales bacterium]
MMGLKSLVLSSDEKVVRLLRRVLSDLEIAIEFCERRDDAIRKLTRERFEAVIVDCDEREAAAGLLKAVRTSPANKRAIAVAIASSSTNLRAAFDMGAHFVLYKPLSAERAKGSFRAARALMKRERRRNFRLPMQVPVSFLGGTATHRALTVDLSEGGFSIRLPRRTLEAGRVRFALMLPGSTLEIEGLGEVAWESPGGHIGIRFTEVCADARHHLKSWLNENASEPEKDDPPVRCHLTDLSLNACYLEVSSPFPIGTQVVLSMRVADLQVRAEGVVRVMHPEIGMGVEFILSTADQRSHVEKFIQALMTNQGARPDLLVEPEGLETDTSPAAPKPGSEQSEDPLLDLFQHKAILPAQAFLAELRKQRRTQVLDPAETVFEI